MNVTLYGLLFVLQYKSNIHNKLLVQVEVEEEEPAAEVKEEVKTEKTEKDEETAEAEQDDPTGNATMW